MTTDHSRNERLRRIEAQTEAIEAAMQEAVDDAVLAHKRLGLPMVEWRDGQIVWTPADQLPTPRPRS